MANQCRGTKIVTLELKMVMTVMLSNDAIPISLEDFL